MSDTSQSSFTSELVAGVTLRQTGPGAAGDVSISIKRQLADVKMILIGAPIFAIWIALMVVFVSRRQVPDTEIMAPMNIAIFGGFVVFAALTVLNQIIGVINTTTITVTDDAIVVKNGPLPMVKGSLRVPRSSFDKLKVREPKNGAKGGFARVVAKGGSGSVDVARWLTVETATLVADTLNHALKQRSG